MTKINIKITYSSNSDKALNLFEISGAELLELVSCPNCKSSLSKKAPLKERAGPWESSTLSCSR